MKTRMTGQFSGTNASDWEDKRRYILGATGSAKDEVRPEITPDRTRHFGEREQNILTALHGVTVPSERNHDVVILFALFSDTGAAVAPEYHAQDAHPGLWGSVAPSSESYSQHPVGQYKPFHFGDDYAEVWIEKSETGEQRIRLGVIPLTTLEQAVRDGHNAVQQLVIHTVDTGLGLLINRVDDRMKEAMRKAAEAVADEQVLLMMTRFGLPDPPNGRSLLLVASTPEPKALTAAA